MCAIVLQAPYAARALCPNSAFPRAHRSDYASWLRHCPPMSTLCPSYHCAVTFQCNQQFHPESPLVTCKRTRQLNGSLDEGVGTCQCLVVHKRGRDKLPRGSAACSSLMCLCLIRHGPSPHALGVRTAYYCRQLGLAVYAWLVELLWGQCLGIRVCSLCSEETPYIAISLCKAKPI